MTLELETPQLAQAQANSTQASTSLYAVAEPYKPKKKTRRSRRGNYRRKKQEEKRLAAEAAAAATGSDTSTTCTESETSCSESYGSSNSPQRCARRRNNRNRPNNFHHNIRNMNVPFHIWQMQQQHQMYYEYNANLYYQEESSLSSGGYSYGRLDRNLPLQVEVQTLSEEQQNQYVALDCEMVGIGSQGIQSALARVTLVDWNGIVLMDEYVKQDQEVTDYRTFVSGITKEQLEQAAMDFASCRKRVQELLKGKILVGHALNNDLGILEIRHPWYMTRDTAMYEPFMKMRFNDGVLWPRGLKDLCKEILHRDVQIYGKPHCPYEDAVAALDLYRSVWQQWEESMGYKLNKTRAIRRANSQPTPYAVVATSK